MSPVETLSSLFAHSLTSCEMQTRSEPNAARRSKENRSREWVRSFEVLRPATFPCHTNTLKIRRRGVECDVRCGALTTICRINGTNMRFIASRDKQEDQFTAKCVRASMHLELVTWPRTSDTEARTHSFSERFPCTESVRPRNEINALSRRPCNALRPPESRC